MKNSRFNFAACLRAACLWALCATTAWAQNDIRGHWSGNIDTPNGSITFEVDLDKAPAGGVLTWIGSMSIPAQGASGIPLDPITFSGGKLSFSIKGPAGAPGFTGTLSADGKTLDGNFTQGLQSLPLKLVRTGEAKVEVPKASAPVAPQFLGAWEGTVNMGTPLRLRLTITNGQAGAEATMVSLDQGNASIPVTSVTQQGAKLTLDVKAIGGGYEGEINKEGTEIKGTFTQVGNSTELLLKKAAEPAK